MGVAGLWPLLEPARSVTTLTALSLTKFNATSRGFRIGIDASIWFFHAEYGKEGENPELRTLFFRCAQLLSQGFLPLFVFDGPLRPDIKRGKRINKSAHKLVTGMQAIIEAFGFEYRTAPGEAEAELAFLNRIGVIDGILSDDVDTFLFGAHTLVRNHSSTHAGAKSMIEKSKVYTYTLPHPALPEIGREELIFIALCSGGDYGTGLDNCGIKISHGLARAGFAKSLCKAALNHDESSVEFQDCIQQWKSELAQELKTNASGFLPRKSPKLANSMPESFPDIKVLLAYLRPVTSETLGRSERYDDLLVNSGGHDGWLKKDPSLPLLAEKCEFYFEWGFLESIIKRFRTVMFHGIALRIMRRACILRQTETCNVNAISLDTIHTHFTSGVCVERVEPSCPMFIKDISKTRTHESTSKTLEYRVAINPSILVQLTTQGVKGIRRSDDEDEWEKFEEEIDEDSSDNEGGTKGKVKKKNEFPDPTLPLKLWLPAVIVKEAIPDVVEAYEEARKRKEEKKAGKGKKVRAAGEEPKAKSPRKPKLKPSAPAAPPETQSTASPPTLKIDKFTNAVDSTDDDDDIDYDERLFFSGRSASAYPKTHMQNNKDRVGRYTLPDSSSDLPSTSTCATSPPPAYRPVASIARKQDIKSAFMVSRPSARNTGKKKATSSSRAEGLLSIIDDIAIKNNKNGKIRQGSRFESSSPEKSTPQPFPLSLQNSFDDDSDDHEYHDPFDPCHIHSPSPPGPPQTPSPREKNRNVNAVVSSDSSASESENSPRKNKDGISNKSPRKSKDHKYPKGHDVGDQPRKTIRDVLHPSRRARASSPTPKKRTPIQSMYTTRTAAYTRSSSMLLPLNSGTALAAPALGPIIISDSEDEEERKVPLPNAGLKTPPKTKLQTRLKPKAVSDIARRNTHNTKHTGSSSSKPISDTFNDNDDIPPLSRARARAKLEEQPISKAKKKTTVTTTTRTKTMVDIIELSDDSA